MSASSARNLANTYNTYNPAANGYHTASSSVPHLPPIPNPISGTLAASANQNSSIGNASAGGYIGLGGVVGGGGARVSSYNTKPSERATGGKGTSIPKTFRPAKTGTSSISAACLQQHKARKDPTVRSPTVTGAEASRGVMSLIERGLLPANASLDGLLGGGIRAMPAPIYNSGVEPFRRKDVIATGSSVFGGGGGVTANIKYDIQQIEKIPPKALHDPDTLKKLMPARIGEGVVPQPPAPAPPPLVDGSNAAAAGADGNSTSNNNAANRDDSRTYSQLLDLYSLHEFIIRKGHTLRNTPEFVSYRRSYSQHWGAIEQVLKLLEELLQVYSVPLAYIDGKKLAALANIDLGTPSKDELLTCIANINEIGHYMVSVVQQFQQKGLSGQSAAAVKIQSMYRMHLARQQYDRLRVATWAARIIQAQWACHRDHLRTRKAIANLKDALALRWRDTMERFIHDWGRIRTSRRTIIHLPSLSYPTHQCKQIGQPFHALQGSQLMRLADLRDPNVDIILISPFKIETEALQYYISTLKAAGAANPEGRIVVLVPENAKRLPVTLSLTKIILLSTKMLRVLTSMAKGKQCYIVPQIVGPDELYLASKLNIPMLATEPRAVPLLSTKSGQRKLFEAAEAATPIGAYHIKTARELYVILSRFIVEYKDISKWVIKINNEEGSRGHAVLDVNRLKSRSAIDPNSGTGGGNHSNAIDAAAAAAGASGGVSVDVVMRELAESAGKRIKIIHPSSYPDWQSFVAMFDQVGGCVEAIPRTIASPTINLFIEPNGEVHINSVVENIFSPPMTVMGSIFPQMTPMLYPALRDASLSIANACFKQRVMGYMSIDFIVYEKFDHVTRERSMRLWAVDLDLHWSNNACMHSYIELLTGAKFDAASGQSIVAATGKPLKYIYSGLIVNPYIGVIRHGAFFATCRERGLSFDTSNKQGVAFHLVDVLLKGCIGAVCIAPSFSACVSHLLGVQQLLQSELPREAETAANSNYAHFVSAVKQLCSLRIAASNENVGGRKARGSDTLM